MLRGGGEYNEDWAEEDNEEDNGEDVAEEKANITYSLCAVTSLVK